MVKEINKKKKQKIKIKAETNSKRIFLLKKDYLLKETDTLVLKNIVKKKVLLSQNNIRKNQLNITTNNIIKINGTNKNLDKEILKISKISKTLGGKPILKMFH